MNELKSIAQRAMLERGLLPELPSAAVAEANNAAAATVVAGPVIRDLRSLLWASIDKVVRGFQGFDVGDRVRVELVAVNVERGFIDFAGPPA